MAWRPQALLSGCVSRARRERISSCAGKPSRGKADDLISVASITLVIAGFLVLASLVQPAAVRLHLPYTVLLAIVGVAVGGFSSFLLYTPLTDRFDGIVGPIVNLPFSASIFLVVFLPLLLFHAALTIDLREIAQDWAPILTLAIVAVFAAATAIGFSLHLAAEVPLTVALLLGAIPERRCCPKRDCGRCNECVGSVADQRLARLPRDGGNTR
jgi:hypothetical protein